MKKFTLLLLGFSFCTSVLAQKGLNENSQKPFYQGKEVSLFVDETINSENETQYLLSKLNLQDGFSLKFDKTIESLTAIHNHYNIEFNGTTVYDGKIHSVTLKRDGKLHKILYNDMPNAPSSTDQSFPPSNAKELLNTYNADVITKDETIWIAQDNVLVPARSTEIMTENTLLKEFIYTNSEVLYEVDHIKHHHAEGPNDTTIMVYVFEPDPLTSAGQNYGGSYVDNNDMTSTVLENERKLRSTIGYFDNGTISLKNDFVEIKELSSPVINPVTRGDNQFLYTRDESGFEDVNTLYHLTTQKLHMDALGFTSLPGYTIEVDAHAIGGDDNSVFFTGASPNRLLFGEGGVDDAEDADVIIHEYTHAYILAASNNNSGTVERDCIEEALGDYFAASYSRTISTYNQDRVYDWDGHNEFWDGRKVESTKDYQQITFVFSIYEHTDLWASPLMEAYWIIGRNGMDQIVMESIYSMGSNTTFRDMAIHVIDADYALNNGANFYTLKDAFVRRNILEANYVSLQESSAPNDLQIFGTYEFSQGGELTLESSDIPIAEVEMYSISGQKVNHLVTSGDKSSINISSKALESGVYLLNVKLTNGQTQSFKVSRF